MQPASQVRGPVLAGALLSALGGLLAGGGCAAHRTGQPADGMYAERTGAFSVRIPRTVFGTRVQDGTNEQGGWVDFSSDDGALWRIEYYPMPADRAVTLADSATRDRFTRGFFVDVVQPDFAAAFPGATLLHSAFVGDSLGRAFFAVLRLPGASASAQLTAEGPKPLDAILHLLLFHRGSLFYVLKLIPGELSGDDRNNPESTPARLLAFRGTIRFGPPN